MNRRQVFLSHKQYYQLSEHLEGTEAFWQEHSMEADCPFRKPPSRPGRCSKRACTG